MKSPVLPEAERNLVGGGSRASLRPHMRRLTPKILDQCKSEVCLVWLGSIILREVACCLTHCRVWPPTRDESTRRSNPHSPSRSAHLRRSIGTFYLLAQKLVFCNSDLDQIDHRLRGGGSGGFPPKPFWIWKHVHVHKVHINEVYAHEVHTHEMHACEVHACEVHAHEVYAREMHAH